jgi:tripartite-type tricarboxylate transporter receptor subunit TctC
MARRIRAGRDFHGCGEPFNSEINKVTADPVVRANFLASAQEPIGGTAEQFAVLVREDYAKFGKLVKDLNIKAE